MQNTLSTLEARIAKLERNNRILLLFCICVPCAVFLLGADAAEAIWQGKKVTAEEFVLTNSDGEVRATLAIREGGGADFALIDKNGKLRVLLTANGTNNENAKKGKDGPALLLLSGDERPALVAGTNRDSGIGSVDFLDSGQYKGGVGGSNLHGS
jgi:hypothetical protein